MRCARCSAEVPDGARFCGRCGAAQPRRCPSCGAATRPEVPFCTACGAPIEAQKGAPEPILATPGAEPTARRTPSRRWVLGGIAALVAVVVVLVLALGSGDGGLGLGRSDEDQVRNVLKREIEAFNKRDLRAAYELLAPQDRERCTYEEVERQIESAIGLLFVFSGDIPTMALSDIRVEVNGNTATAAFTVKADGEVLSVESDDQFVKVDGRWYDLDEDGDLC